MKNNNQFQQDDICGEDGSIIPSFPLDKTQNNTQMLQVFPLREGLLTLETHNYQLRHDIRISHDIDFPPTLIFYACLSGEWQIQYPKKIKRIGKGDCGAEIIRHGVVQSTQISSRRPTRVFCVNLAQSLFFELTGKKEDDVRDLLNFSKKKGAGGRQTRDLDTAMAICAHQVLSAAENYPSDTLFLEAKALELVSLQIKKLEIISKKNTDPAPFLRTDADKVILAADILKKEMDGPPGGMILSRRIGLNYNKMLLGFKKILGMTPVEYLRSVRLQKACDCIRSGEMNVTQAAFSVGYSSLSHFTKAFYREFGMNPKKCAPKKGRKT